MRSQPVSMATKFFNTEDGFLFVYFGSSDPSAGWQILWDVVTIVGTQNGLLSRLVDE
ncbi:MAG: hypothetical protein GVY08_14310 [Bacteroidetes bacterium]|nr:hypothetical protein [Bacteroidota bacterium]